MTVALFAGTAAAATPTGFGVQALRAPAGTARDIDQAGDVLLQTESDDGLGTGYLLHASGSGVVLGCTDGSSSSSYAAAMSVVGVAVGSCETASYATVGVVWSADGTPSALPGLPGADPQTDLVQPSDINRHGDVVGEAQLPDGSGSAAVRWSGPEHSISMIDSKDPSAYVDVLNDRGYAAGSVGGHAAVFTPRGYVKALQQLPGEDYSVVTAINNRGVAVGTSTIGIRTYPMMWSMSGAMTALALPAQSTSATPTSINRSGEIVGLADRPDGGLAAVVWTTSTTPTLLPDLAGSDPTSALYEANAINDRGVIAGNSYDSRRGRTRPVTWTMSSTE